MKREKINALNEKDFATSLIMSNKCCQKLIPYIDLDYFESDYTRIVVSWVMEYYKKFKQCPKDDIVSLYRTHSDEIQDEALKDTVASYLQNLADSNLNINNEDYLLDRSKDYLDKRSLNMYSERIKACLDTGNVEKARKIQQQYKKISPKETNEVSLFSKQDVKIVQEALAKVDEELMVLPKALNDVTGKLHRDDFMAILAKPKGGKSFFMQYLALQAVMQSLNVVFVSMEMSREEVIQRLWKMQFGSKSGIVPEGTYETSKIVESDEEGKYTSQLIDVKVRATNGKSVSALQKQVKATNQYKGDLRVIAYPPFGASVEDIETRVEELADEGFIADVVIIDYADITKPIGGGSEVRNQLDAIWKSLRHFAMDFHCLLISASQTNRTALNSATVGADTISEDFRKLAHITSFVSMEQTPKMKNEHLMRIRNIAVRNGQVEETCVFPQALGLGQFMFGKPVLGKDFVFADGEDEE